LRIAAKSEKIIFSTPVFALPGIGKPPFAPFQNLPKDLFQRDQMELHRAVATALAVLKAFVDGKWRDRKDGQAGCRKQEESGCEAGGRL